MSALYAGFLTEHKNQPPKDEQEFRDYLTKKQESLEKVGLTFDAMFTSPRNGQPLQWIYGKSPPMRISGINVIAYEKTPTDGKRLAIGNLGMYEVIDDAQFKGSFPKSK